MSCEYITGTVTAHPAREGKGSQNGSHVSPGSVPRGSGQRACRIRPGCDHEPGDATGTRRGRAEQWSASTPSNEREGVRLLTSSGARHVVGPA